MPLAKLAIKQPLFITMVLLAVVLVGVLSYINMGVELYPDISNPSVNVSVSFPGASPQDVQTLVAKPLEQALSTIAGVNTISSTSNQGSANVMVSFDAGYNIEQGASEVRERLDSIQRSLPSGASVPVMRRFDPNSMPFMMVALKVSGNPSPSDLRQLIELVIEPRLEQVPGVAAATVNGYPIQAIGVNLDSDKLTALQITPQQIVNALAAQNVTIPSGSIINPKEKIPIRTTAKLQNLDEINNIVIAQKGTLAITLSQVAAVGTQLENATSFTRVNGQNAMVMELQSQSGSNVVQTAGQAREELQALEKQYPNVSFTILTDNSTFIQQSDHDVVLTMILGALLAAIIVFMFIRDIRNTLITIAGLPIVVLGTFAVINALGFTLNIITLMALSLSIGLLIDDAIVVRENIFRHIEHGASPKEAADKGTGEIAFAVLAITLTIVAVFIPVAFTTGTIGMLFKQFGITVAVAMLISLFEAFTFAPLLTAYFARPLKAAHIEARKKTGRGFLSRWAGIWQSTTNDYKNILGWSVRHRLAIISVALVLFLGSIWLMRSLPLSFFPATDEGRISVGVNLPPGNSLETTDQVVQKVEQTALAQPEVKTVYARVGGGSSAYSGSLSMQLKNGANTDEVLARMRRLLSQYTGIVTLNKPSQFLGVGGGMMGGGNVRSMPLQITVQGPVDQSTLDGVAAQIMSRLQDIPGVQEVRVSTPPQQPELDVTVNRQRCAAAGVNSSTVGQTISILFSGTTATQIDWQDQLTDVIVQLQPQDLADPATLMSVPIASTSGNFYPLSSVANIAVGTGPTTLSRQNQQAIVTIGANLQGRTQGEIVPDVQKAMQGITLPASVSWQFAGMQAQAQSAYSSLIFAMMIGLIFIYMVLTSQFGSLMHPFTVMVALPLAIIGSVVAMVVTHTELTVISMIGIILMMGLATKNSILLVDFIIRYRRQGRNRTEAVIEAGLVRLRPIMMTSLAIILGMIPTAVAMGASGSFRAPMAITVIGGEFTSTLLSLLVVPVVYTLLDDAMVAVFHRTRKTSTAGAPALSGAEEETQEIGETTLNGLSKRPARWRGWFRKK